MGWGVTLEDAVRKAFQEGREKDLVGLIRLLPHEKKEQYRELWKKMREQDAQKEKRKD